MTILASFPCSNNIPPSYSVPVKGPGLLAEGETVGGLASKYVEANAALHIANGHTADVIAIVAKCDASQERVAKALQPRPWWLMWK